MKYFFPDSQDFVDPNYDFDAEKHSPLRVSQRDDVYAHHLLPKPYDGLLISKAIVDGVPGNTSKTRYSRGQRYRLYREGAHAFFRLSNTYQVMGDSGAFSYVNEASPPYNVDDLVNFYVKSRVNSGISLDHVIMDYQDRNRRLDSDAIQSARERIEITLTNAEEFLRSSKGCAYTPYGVAQGWDQNSYIGSVVSLLKMGYQHITIGGVVSLNSAQICNLLDEIRSQVHDSFVIHLLGIGRLDIIPHLIKRNVTSVDSTTPLKQSFLNEKKNYRLGKETFCAIRLPQSFGNTKVKRAISSGKLSQEEVKNTEELALRAIKEYGKRLLDIDETLKAIHRYESLVFDRGRSFLDEYARTLEMRPWELCDCNICKDIGVETVVFRGSERNKRRAFHNLYDFYSNLRTAYEKESFKN
ncbi:tRNA-guanine transglycosylase DpdA [Vibrio renipiscarius]|uniref:tRNA-guanine transglycosylase DpdA n=1 Tax=Vibrio renipiscarius TaxID=1461322 RepID=UPI00354CCC60